MYAAGICCENGLGVPLDQKLYLQWMLKGASMRHEGAMREVLLEGLDGVKDEKKAIELTTQGALKGNPFIQGSLGMLYLLDAEALKDYEQAFYWLERSCAQGLGGFWLVALSRVRYMEPGVILEFLKMTSNTYLPIPTLKAQATLEFNYAMTRLAMEQNG
jgi:hypothetical protein